MKRFIFYALDQYTLKVYRRKEWEAGVRHGIVCEQQRIIKLLEEQKTAYKGIMSSARSMGAIDTLYHWEHKIKILDSYIKLIKGETKPFLTTAQVKQMADEMLEE
jgi:hypothetical protein